MNDLKNNEIWKAVNLPNVKDGFMISSLGRFKNSKNGGSLGLVYHATNGYDFNLISFNDNNQNYYKLIPVDILVASAFIDQPILLNAPKLTIRHIDGDTRNNSVNNLEWVEDFEEWRPVTYPDVYLDKYEISSHGRLRRASDKSIITGSTICNRYIAAGLKVYSKQSGQSSTIAIHRLVAHAFLDLNCSDKSLVVNHIDNDGTNNHVRNIEVVTQQLNAQHASLITAMTDISIEEMDIIRDMLMDPQYRGSTKLIYETLHDSHPSITLGKIRAIKHKSAYNNSYSKYNIREINYCDYIDDVIPTCELDMIRDLLLDENCHHSSEAIYKRIDHIKFPRITKSVIVGVKRGAKPYMRSERYNLKDFNNQMKQVMFSKKGQAKRMQSLINIPTETVDLVRELLVLNVFHGSPTFVHNALNHEKYPNVTINVIKHIAYDNSEASAYYRTNYMDLDEFFDRLSTKTFKTANRQLIDALTVSYSHGVPDINDESFDLIVEDYVTNYGEENRPFMRVHKSESVNAMPPTLSKVYGVKEPMRPGQKIYADWVDSLLNHGVSNNATVIVQVKYDGCSIALDVKTGRYFTRGDYDNGESMDVTELFGRRVSMHGDVNDFAGLMSVKFEAIMSEEAFHELGLDQKYVNARAATSAIIMSRDKKLAQYISLQPLRCYYDDGGMTIPEELERLSVICSLDAFDTIQNFIDEKLANGAKVQVSEEGPYAITSAHYAIDGVVVSVLENDHSCELMKPHMEIAIKILNNIKETKIIDIDWQLGKTGKITPVGILEPVTFDNGVTVDHVGLSTYDRVHDLTLHFGDTVRIVHNIVPYLLDSKHDGGMIIPLLSKCPSCGAPLAMSNLKTVRCVNPNCENKKIGDIIRYCENMKMMGISKGILTKLYEMGYVKTIVDLYTFDGEALSMEKGFAETSVRALKKSISDASTDVPLERFLSALPCTNVSKKTWQMIINARANQGVAYNTTDMDITSSYILGRIVKSLRLSSPDFFLRLITEYTYGIGDTTWKAIHFGIIENWEMIRSIMQYVTIDICDKKKPNAEYKGMVCFTGHRDRNLAALLEQNGYAVTDDFTSHVDALVIPDVSYMSSKVKKALKKHIPIFTIRDVVSRLNSTGNII